MKREYAKPIIVFEDFTLTTSIASGCEVKTNLQAMGNCGWIPATAGLKAQFLWIIRLGVLILPHKPYMIRICYHVPTESYNLFNS